MRAKTASNLRQLSVATHTYATDHNGKLPRMRAVSEAGARWQGPWWTDQILPYISSSDEDNSVFFCPLEENHHPDIADYGCNQSLFESRNDHPEVTIYHLASSPDLILFSMAREVANDRGGWFINRSFGRTGGGDSRPSDRGTGLIYSAHADGHISEMTPEELSERAEGLLIWSGN